MRKERTTVLSSSCPQDLLFWKNFVYTGSGIPEGKKSVAFNLTLRSDDRSLTAQEADEDVKSILETLKAELNAVLR